VPLWYPQKIVRNLKDIRAQYFPVKSSIFQFNAALQINSQLLCHSWTTSKKRHPWICLQIQYYFIIQYHIIKGTCNHIQILIYDYHKITESKANKIQQNYKKRSIWVNIEVNELTLRSARNRIIKVIWQSIRNNIMLCRINALDEKKKVPNNQPPVTVCSLSSRQNLWSLHLLEVNHSYEAGATFGP